MTDRRKLQAEIDRVLKKVTEGTDDFEECLEKFHQNSNNPTQKEKYENDLKKEIKKLQRLRDQLKTWIQSSDIKDKTPLVEARKAIESLMERFKVVERETKTKAYSKEGLQAVEKRDLELEERENLTEWIKEQLVKFNRLIDVCESELESLLASNRKKKTAKDADRIGRLTSTIDRHRFHVHRLETILRAVDNKAILPSLLTKTPMYVDEDQRADLLTNQDDDGADDDDGEERNITFCLIIEHYLDRCNEEGFREVTDLYEQLTIDDNVDFSLPSVAALAAASGTSTSAGPSTSQPSGAPTVPSSALIAGSSAPSQPPVASALDEKDTERDSRERDKSDKVAQTNGTRSEDHSQEDLRKRQKSEERSARSKANQISSSSSVTAEKSPTAPPSKTPGVTSQPEPAPAATTSSVPASTAPTVAPLTPRAAAQRTTSTSYAKSVTHSDVAAFEQPPHAPPPPQPTLSYSTVVSSTGISYAAVAATASASSAVPPPSNQPASNTPQPPAAPSSIQTNVNALMSTATSAAPTSAVQNTLPVSATTSQFGTQATPSQQPAPPITYPLSFTAPASQPQQSELHTPASLATQAQAAALQNSLSSDALTLALAARADQSAAAASQQQLAAAAANLPHSALTTGVTVQTGIAPQPAPSSPGSNNPQSELGVAPAASFASSVNGSLPLPQPQPKVVVHLNPVLGVTPFGLKELNPAACEQHDIVERARKHMPQPCDSERARICLPRIPVVTPSYYPQQVPANVDSVEFFIRQQPETLFFVFYYMEGTRAQLLAARALKRLQWRYHSKYLMWFQRLTEPSVMNDELETGTYIYFDYERWQMKRKEQFTFDYRYLEDNP